MDFMKLFGTVIAVLFHPGSVSEINGKSFQKTLLILCNHVYFICTVRLVCVYWGRKKTAQAVHVKQLLILFVFVGRDEFEVSPQTQHLCQVDWSLETPPLEPLSLSGHPLPTGR